MTSATSKYILDSHAWIEYFKGSDKGEKVKGIIEGGRAYTPIVVLTEVSYWYSKQGVEFRDRVNFITANSIVANANEQIAVNAGKIKNLIRKKYKNNFGTIDALILATARSIKAEVVTGDYHFKPLKNVHYIGN